MMKCSLTVILFTLLVTNMGDESGGPALATGLRTLKVLHVLGEDDCIIAMLGFMVFKIHRA